MFNLRLPAASLLLAAAMAAAGTKGSAEVNAAVPDTHKPATVSLARVGCFWQCPEYSVTVRADGWVGYQGFRHVDIEGARAWKLPAAEVTALFARASHPALAAADDRYVEPVYDGETIMLRAEAGGKRKQILIYPSNGEGIPTAVQELLEAFDNLSGLRRWVRLSDETIRLLEKEGFDFTSPAAGALLVRSIRPTGEINEAAILQLLAMGAPVETAERASNWTVLDIALRRRMARLITPLIDRGVLMTGGRPDQGKIDNAFQSAIRGGQLEPVKDIWEIAGTRPHPALDFADVGTGSAPSSRRTPVALLLERDLSRDESWEGLEIVTWLETLGTDLSAMSEDGRTLIHVAAQADDPQLMLFLLARDLDPTVVGTRELMRFSVRHGESMALALLETQAERPPNCRLLARYREVALSQEWPRVIAWLDAHHEVTARKQAPPCANLFGMVNFETFFAHSTPSI